MKEEQIKILKTMNEATSRMNLNTFAETVNLSPDQAMEMVQGLAREGFLRKVGSGYGLNEKGKNALKVSVQVPDELAFHFYVGVDRPLGFSAHSLEEFYRLVRQVCSDSLEFHLFRGHFERWLQDVLKDEQLAEAVAGLRTAELKGEDLRKAMLKAIDDKYGVGELL